jgi:membrane-associated protease RseP (regulator of RpoE activity)
MKFDVVTSILGVNAIKPEVRVRGRLGPWSRRLVFVVFVAHFITSLPASFAQTAADTYRIGASIIVGSKEGCTLFIGGVGSKSPAERAGIRSGDRLLAIDGKDVKGMQLSQVAALLRSNRPGSVRLKLWHMGKEYEVKVQREKYASILAAEGMKLAGPFVVPQDTSEVEIKRMVDIESEHRPIVGRVFPLHYPLNKDIYCGGFEIFLLDNPPQVIVGGLERGPAARAGIHQGDIILSVNGVNPTGKTKEELESLFSSNQPRLVTLVVDRVTETKTLRFKLEKASEIMSENHVRMFNGKFIPADVAEEDIHCFL